LAPRWLRHWAGARRDMKNSDYAGRCSTSAATRTRVRLPASPLRSMNRFVAESISTPRRLHGLRGVLYYPPPCPLPVVVQIQMPDPPRPLASNAGPIRFPNQHVGVMQRVSCRRYRLRCPSFCGGTIQRCTFKRFLQLEPRPPQTESPRPRYRHFEDETV